MIETLNCLTFTFKRSCTAADFEKLNPEDFKNGDVVCITDTSTDTYQTYVQFDGEWIEISPSDQLNEETENDRLHENLELVSNCKNCGAPLYYDMSTSYKIDARIKCKYCNTIQSIWKVKKEEYS